MTKTDRDFWLSHTYPLTIISDRYSGVYSGGQYVAFPLQFDEIDTRVSDEDVECAEFWAEADLDTIGLGETPEAALQDPKEKMSRSLC